MTIADSYNQWAASYDTVANKTRDLEAQALRDTLLALGHPLGRVLELGCGTGKNTSWLAEHATHLTAVDFSTEMMQQARQKLAGHQPPISFQQTDITRPWPFAAASFDLLSCSLILEHVENLDSVFAQARRVLRPSGLFYIGELHPFRQYQGSKARFEAAGGTVELQAYVHHISDFTEGARRQGLGCRQLREWFDAGSGQQGVAPRIVSFLFEAEE